MEKQTIRKSVEVNAPKEIVWEVLLNDSFTRVWYAAFSPGSRAETDWKVGSKAVFTDDSKCGLIGKVLENIPYERLTVEYTGFVNAGVEDYESATAEEVKGGLEVYRLAEKNGITHLSIACDMSEEMFEAMSSAWDKALQKIKQLAESQTELKSNLLLTS
jgi:uncharacterized protein YndB with AHSA1/START domain